MAVDIGVNSDKKGGYIIPPSLDQPLKKLGLEPSDLMTLYACDSRWVAVTKSGGENSYHEDNKIRKPLADHDVERDE